MMGRRRCAGGSSSATDVEPASSVLMLSCVLLLFAAPVLGFNQVRSGEHCTPGVITCYMDGEPRILGNSSIMSNSLTLESCALLCHQAKFSLAGAEDGGECYCGNDLSPGATKAPASECDQLCSGDSSESCGGFWRISVYTFDCSSAPEVIQAADARVAWSGRTQSSSDGAVSFDWLGVTAQIEVVGATYLTAEIHTTAAVRGTRLKAYASDQGFGLYPLIQFWVTPLVQTTVLFASPSAASTTITIENLVDPQYGTGVTTITSFKSDGTFQHTPGFKRHIEFVGDSITAATNVVRPPGAPGCGDAGLQSDFSQTYEAQLCHKFGTSCSTIAVGGKCMIRECGGLQMPDYYLSQYFKDNGAPTYGFMAAGPAPDAIFINLGTNDNALFPSDADLFVTTTLEFLHNATVLYGSKNIQFFLSIGPMENATGSATRDAVAQAVNQGLKVTAVDMQTACVKARQHGNSDHCDGCAGHPGIQGHFQMYEAAWPVVAQVMGWS